MRLLRNEWLALGLAVTTCSPPPPDTAKEIPIAPEAGATSSQTVSTFAIQTLFVGEVPITGGMPSNAAWKAFGYNLDDLVTTETSTNVCVLGAGTPKINQIDGNDGIDNAWGSVVLPLIQSAVSLPAPSQDATSFIKSGAWTLQVQVIGLSTDPNQTALGLDAQVFVSGAFGSVPAFDQTTDWPVLSSSLVDGATIAGGALVHFSNVYVTGGTLVAQGASQPLVVSLVIHDSGLSFCFSASCADAGPPINPPIVASLPLRIHDATLTFVHATPTTAAQGVIAGVLDPLELIDTFQSLVGLQSTLFCGQAFTPIAQQVEQASDILQDGTNASGVPCDGISIGIGFTAALVANPTQVGVEPPPQPNPCDAGAD